MKSNVHVIGAFEAKNKFSELLERVGRGAEFMITKHDKPIARLIPAAKTTLEERRKIGAELRELSKRYSLKGLSLIDLINEDRK